MRAKVVVWLGIAWLLVTLACAQTAPPTVPAGAMETAVAQTVEARLSEAAPSATPLPTATDTPTVAPSPTQTETPTVAPSPTSTETPASPPPAPTLKPTPIPSPTPSPTPCSGAIAAEFQDRLNAHPDILALLGCPRARHETWAAMQVFQNGRMFWTQDSRTIYILYSAPVRFEGQPDQYVEGDPEDACPERGKAPEGLFKPLRGFNRPWCNIARVRDALGWALAGEVGYQAVWQEFERGYVRSDPAGHVFIFLANGTWNYIE